MPQARKKVPFSGKAKKQQLLAKRHKKAGLSSVGLQRGGGAADDESEGSLPGDRIQKINSQPNVRGPKSKPNRYALQFHRETEAEIRERREAVRKTFVPVEEKDLEIDVNTYFTPDLDFPTRPTWNYGMTPAQLDAREHRYFTEYVTELEKKFEWKDLSYFELNLETWRQLWRVLEMSDIILIIVDIRFPAWMFPPSLYTYVTEKLKKDMILVLNKVDLAPAPLVLAWKHYFQEKYPELHVLMFTSYPDYNLRLNLDNPKKEGGLQVRRRRGKMRMAAEGAQKLLEACKTIVKDQVDLTSWQNKIAEEMEIEFENDDLEAEETISLKKTDTSYVEHVKYKDGTLTIGCVGQPNVGKSSLMNAIMGKKVVSVSRTPGHTKYFQTIWLTKTVRLCDCPGLVFPSKVQKVQQILMGSFPIAQVREPFSTVQFIAERMDLVKLLKLQHPEGDDEWSAMDICDGWAKKRGFLTAKAARLDSYRAANHLLRMSLEGKICMCLYPPGYTSKKEFWATHPEVEIVRWIQARHTDHCSAQPVHIDLSSDDEEDFSASQAEAGRGNDDEEEGDDADDSSNGGSMDEDDGDDDDDDASPVGAANKFAALGVDDD
ncbi:Guanine nucleotide-binding protein-like 1 [Frankliniella fusca]|uniref:Guanine nucleotide-binding protein-like 1 n=1 Tax=Frankliniella fusca TaxID=407009 RepID=A0AAE1HUW6_9NEOP|nr:Guanine nucleotide-binding protein-like 1 [Frankliniella fusca]